MSISKKTRFEVFKRDKFTCQYCGKKAPDVTLQVDHIEPKASDGTDDIMNLITSCYDCNMGKGARRLSDGSVIRKQQAQLEELEERRQQLEMMLKWQKSLIDFDQQIVGRLAEFWSDLVPGFCLSESGRQNLSKWCRRFDLEEIIEGMTLSTNQYLIFDNEENPEIPSKESVEKAFDYVSRICATRRRMKERPYLRDLYYIRGILNNRLSYINKWLAIQLMEDALKSGHSMDDIKTIALEVNNWTEFRATMETLGTEA